MGRKSKTAPKMVNISIHINGVSADIPLDDDERIISKEKIFKNLGAVMKEIDLYRLKPSTETTASKFPRKVLPSLPQLTKQPQQESSPPQHIQQIQIPQLQQQQMQIQIPQQQQQQMQIQQQKQHIHQMQVQQQIKRQIKQVQQQIQKQQKMQIQLQMQQISHIFFDAPKMTAAQDAGRFSVFPILTAHDSEVYQNYQSNPIPAQTARTVNFGEEKNNSSESSNEIAAEWDRLWGSKPDLCYNFKQKEMQNALTGCSEINLLEEQSIFRAFSLV